MAQVCAYRNGPRCESRETKIAQKSNYAMETGAAARQNKPMDFRPMTRRGRAARGPALPRPFLARHLGRGSPSGRSGHGQTGSQHLGAAGTARRRSGIRRRPGLRLQRPARRPGQHPVLPAGQQDDAQEAAQEAFLKCWRPGPACGDPQPAGLDLSRRPEHGQGHAAQRLASPSQAPDGERSHVARSGGRSHRPRPEDQEALERLRRAILDLREEEKEVFLLRQNGDLTYEQIAELHQSPVGTVKTQMRSALQKLRDVLHEGPPT